MITLGIFVVHIVVTLRSLALNSRGYVFRKKNDLFFKCHNCGVGATLGNLIKHVDSKTYKDYIFERYRSGVKTNNPGTGVQV